MFAVGDRVWIVAGPFKGEKATIQHGFDDEGDYDVLIDGRPLLFYIHASQLAKVEVTVIEGPLTWNERGCYWMVGDKNLDHYLDNNGDIIRITIEKLPKEGK